MTFVTFSHTLLQPCSLKLCDGEHWAQKLLSYLDVSSLWGLKEVFCSKKTLRELWAMLEVWEKWELSMKITSYLVNENWERQLRVIDGSISYRVIYRVELDRTMNWMHSQLHCTPTRGHWDNFLVNLGYGGTDLVCGCQKYISKYIHYCFG